MASSSSNSAQASSSRSWKYDVFLSFRGKDTRKTFVDHLYSALVERLIRVYKDDEALPRGDSIGPSLFKSIEESRIAVIVFSENYAESSWCLDELLYIMKCRERGLIVIPIFYDVDPSEVRYRERKFGEAFAKHEAEDFMKADLWRSALFDASKLAGWEPKHIANGHETKVIKEIVDKIQDRIFTLGSDVDLDSDADEDLVGIRERLRELMPLLQIGMGGVRMVGIWGIGGSGKTTLASSVYTEISHHFHSHCFISNIREKSKHGLETLQQKLLSTLFKTKEEVQSVEEGKSMIKSWLRHRKVLVVLDDVNDLDELEALVGSHKWFGPGSRIIITTRDEHLLRTHRVDHVTPIRLFSHEEAIRLFYMNAYNEKEPLPEYESLSLQAVSYAAGLPLALRVLGSFLFDKDKNEWISALAKLRDIPDVKIMHILRISYDGLETLQKELFLDIACFFRWKSVDDAKEILDACGFHPVIGIKVLTQKALITTTDGMFDMHDLVQQMGHYIVRGEHPNDPEKHSRVWKNEEIIKMCCWGSTMENDMIEAMRYHGHSSSRLFEFIANMKKLRWLSVVIYLGDYKAEHTEGLSFLSNELRYLYWERYPAFPFPDSFQPMKLVVLKLHYSLQKELWNGRKCLPHLKVLQLCFMSNLLSTPDFDGLPCLETLVLRYCNKLKEIHPSLGNRRSLEYLQLCYMENLISIPNFYGAPYLKYVSVRSCKKLRTFPKIVQTRNLKTFEIENCYSILPSSVGERFTQLETVFHQFKKMMNLSSLQKLDLSGWGLKDGEIPSDIGELSNLEELHLSRNDFSRLGFSLSQLTRLKILIMSECKWLVELPELPSSIIVLEADYCVSLASIGNNCQTNFKCLCEVSFLRNSQGILNGADRLVESMLQGMGIQEALTRRTKLELPDNWCNDFCGFLICFFTKYSTPLRYTMRMWNSRRCRPRFGCLNRSLERSIGGQRTWVGFVSFASLRHTSWWEQTQNTGNFYFSDGDFKFALVPNKSGIAPTDFLDVRRLNIVNDSTSVLTIEISFFTNDKSGEETIDHLLISCSIASQVWNFISTWCNIPQIYAFRVRDLLQIHHHLGLSTEKAKVIQVIIICACWLIWKSRNDHIFNGQKRPKAMVVRGN